MRQQFTAKERDIETGLDYFLARYYSSIQGRFSSPDHFDGNPARLFSSFERSSSMPYATLLNPQTFNLYHYAFNSPVSFVDVDGHQGGKRQPLPGDKRYTIRPDFNNPNDSPNVHVFDRKGKEIGRVAVKGTAENIVYDWGDSKVPPRVRVNVEDFIKEKGIQPRPPLQPQNPAGGATTQPPARTRGRGGRSGSRVVAALAILSIIIDAISQNKDEAELGYYFDYLENLIIVDLAKAVQNLPQGTTIQFEGIYFRLRGDKFMSIDPNCSGCVLKQDPDGKITIQGCKRCAE